MTLASIATLLNTVMVPNLLGEEEIIAEDLSNVVDLGKAVASLTADDLKDYMNQFALGVVKNYVDTRQYKRETYGIFMDEIEFGGAVQRIKARLLKAYDTPILTLENFNADPQAPDYNDGHYYGTSTDSKIYNKSTALLIPYSIPVEMFKKSFMDAAGVRKLVSLIESNVDNTLTVELNALSKAVLRKLALTCNSARKINLITLYNTNFGFSSGDEGFVTLTNWKNDTNFKLWCEEVIIQLKKHITDYNMKYNDGTIETFCPEEDTRVVMLSEFGTALDFAQSSVYHRELTDVGSYMTINFWQNNTEALLPQISATSEHDMISEVVGDATTTISHVVGIVFDKYTASMTTRLNKTTSDYIAKGDFRTMFHHLVVDYAIDGRNSAIVLCLA